MTSQHALEVAAGARFTFGENWSRFLRGLDDERIAQAEQSLREMFGVQTLEGRSFLDIGSGSGLFSLAARRLGATVHSFDYDPKSVACTTELRRRYYPDDSRWKVEQASALDAAYVASLGRFDVVYSWGVLHHTGQMYRGFENAAAAVADHGTLFIAIYNDQGWVSRYWTWVKRWYNRGPLPRAALIAIHWPYLYGVRWIVRAASGRLEVERGMSLWYDMLDWLGGYPFEVATPEAVVEFFRGRGFATGRLKTCGTRLGCNEFVFQRG